MIHPFAAAAILAIGAIEPQEPSILPIELDAVASPLTDDGAFALRFLATPLEPISKRYAMRVALGDGPEELLFETTHELKTNKWKVGERVHWTVPLALPKGVELFPGQFVPVRVGFLDPGGTQTLLPRGAQADDVGDDGLAIVTDVEAPAYLGAAGDARLRTEIERAHEHAAAGEAFEAWAVLDEALRNTADYTTKKALRLELAKVGRLDPPRQTEVEQGIVRQRIRAEKVRVLRIEAGRLYDRGMLHGALRLLEEAGGELTVAADEAVIGAVNDADRMMQRTDDLRERLLTEISDEDAVRIDPLVEKHGRTEKLLRAADGLAEKHDFPLALALYRKLRRVDGVELYDRAQERLEVVGGQYLADTPADQAEAVRKVSAHPSWARTKVARSHCFLFIGPEKLLDGIPDESRLRFDLAYVLLTDLFGRRPNPEGDRVTVYFKELFDFGGGIGGGKIIDIGRADPDPRKPVRVDNGLLYHELTHCIDDTRPIHAGFREGLANVGAAFAYEALDQSSDALHSFDRNLEAFRTYFLERDLEYWRIQNYGPSAGLFLHFVDKYAPGAASAHEWSGLRRFFREYRWAPVHDGREPAVARGLAHFLGRAFGPEAFDDLVSFGFPLVESDRRLVAREMDAFEGGVHIAEFQGAFTEHPNSFLPRDSIERELASASRREDLERSAELRAELGVVFDWKVVGPFFANGADPGAHVFVPEYEVDFAQKPRTWRASRADHTQRTWQDPSKSWVRQRSHRNVLLHLSGWILFDYEPYGDDNSAIYAVTHVTVPEAVDALAHVRADDDFALFIGDRRVIAYRGRGKNGSSEHTWRGPYEPAPDAMRAPVRFEAGRNKVLVKVRNRQGPAGVALAFSRPDGSRLAFQTDADPPDVPGPRPPIAAPDWKRVTTLDHRTIKSKTKATVGGFRAKNKAVYGTADDGGVGWRLFTVRPGFPKDSPSNLMWLKPSLTKELTDVRVDVTLASDEAPKMVVTIQGEGGDDGLSGWNLILVPRRGNKLLARLERYDRLVYQTEALELSAVPEGGRTLTLQSWNGWLSAAIDDVVLFERVSIAPIPGRDRIGVATWGPGVKIRSIELSKSR
ncbi:MAG: hypothetical protein GY711_01145 [bacterium]|nr:hypothetical protein [bacterium]